MRDGLIHGDYFRGKLCRGTDVVGLVDFEEARVDWLAFDLASAVWEFCKLPPTMCTSTSERHSISSVRTSTPVAPRNSCIL